MANSTADRILRHLRRLAAGPTPAVPDADLVRRFVADHDTHALESLIERHGPMVLNVCRRSTDNREDAEDIFQATFLLLVRKAGSLRSRESVGSWLYGVAFRLARQVRIANMGRRAREQSAATRPSVDPLAELTVREAQTILDEELARLPEKYRAALVLCCLDGRTRDEAAADLGCSLNSLRCRLEQARHRLRHRLIRRGLTLPAAAIAALLTDGVTSAAVSGELLNAAVETAIGAETTARAAVLVAQLVRAESWSVAKATTALALAAGMVAAGVGLSGRGTGADPQPEKPPVAVAEVLRPAADLYGDPLPAGAIARLGTVRLRHPGFVWSVALAPDGKTLASAASGGTIFWDPATGREVGRLPTTTSADSGAAFFPDGKKIAIRGYDRSIRIWDVATRRQLLAIKTDLNSAVCGLAISPDGKSIAAGAAASSNGQKTLCIWDADTGRELFDFGEARVGVLSVAFSPDGAMLAAGMSSGAVEDAARVPPLAGRSAVRLWDSRTGKEIRLLEGHVGGVSGVAFSPDGKHLVSGSHDSTIRVWEVTTGHEVRKIAIPCGNAKPSSIGRVADNGGLSSMALSPDGKTAAAGCQDGVISLWNIAAGTEIRTLRWHLSEVKSLAFSPDGKSLASGSSDDTVQIWDTGSGKPLWPAVGHQSYAYAVALTPDGKTAITGGYDNMVRVWDTTTGRQRGIVPRGNMALRTWTIALSPDGKSIAIGEEQAARTWDLASGKEVTRLDGNDGRIAYISFSPDGRQVATAADNSDVRPRIDTVRLWDATTGQPIRTLYAGPRGLGPLVFSPDGKTLLAANDKTRVWDLTTGKNDLRSFESWIGCAFAADGHSVIAIGPDYIARLYDPVTGKEQRLLGSLKSKIPRSANGVSFAADRRTLAWVGDDSRVHVWELASHQERCSFAGHSAMMNSAILSADGRLLLSGSQDTTALVWDVTGLAANGALPRLDPTPQQLTELWTDLAHTDAARAGRAVWTLVAGAERSVPFLRERLRPAPADVSQLTRWIADLDSDKFATRQAGTQGLDALGESAAPTLTDAVKNGKSAEARQRAQQLLDRLRDFDQTPEGLRIIRAIEALEQIGTSPARQALQDLARGPEGTLRTREAVTAMKRLDDKR